MKYSPVMFLSSILIMLILIGSYSVQGQETNFSSEMILYTTFDDFNYSINAIEPDGDNQRVLVQTQSGWFEPSPNGEKIVFLNRNNPHLEQVEYDVYLINADGSDQIRLTTTGHNIQPVWSPFGDKIAYLSGENNNFDIYLIDLADLNIAQGRHPNPIRLTDVESIIASLIWSPDGSRLAFVTCDEKFHCDINLMNSDGTGIKNVTDNFDDIVSSISWSPDNQYIAFTAYPLGEYQNADIYMLDIQSRVVFRLSQASADYVSLEWSPNSSKLAYASNQAGTWDIYLLNPDTLESTNLTAASETQDGFYGLSWSPDGRHIAFSSGPLEGYFEIFVMNSDGTSILQLTSDDIHNTDPIWVTNFPNS